MELFKYISIIGFGIFIIINILFIGTVIYDLNLIESDNYSEKFNKLSLYKSLAGASVLFFFFCFFSLECLFFFKSLKILSFIGILFFLCTTMLYIRKFIINLKEENSKPIDQLKVCFYTLFMYSTTLSSTLLIKCLTT